MAADPVVGAAISSVGGVLSSAGNVVSTVLTNEANKKLAEYQYQKNKEMWQMQNWYNSPSQQMARYKAAGLNPNLIYGNGSSSAGNASEIPRYQAPTMQAPDFSGLASAATNAVNTYMDYEVKQAQVDNLEAQKRQTDTLTQSETIKQLGYNLANQSNEFDLGLKRELRQYNADIVRSDARRAMLQNENLLKDLEVKNVGIARTNQDILHSQQEINQSKSTVNLQQQQIRMLKLQMDKIPYEIAKIKADTSLTLQEKDNKIQDLENAKKQGDILIEEYYDKHRGLGGDLLTSPLRVILRNIGR